MHTNKINNKRYIGITGQDTPEDRWRNGRGYRTGYFKNAILKYGWDNFEHEILEDGLTLDEANEKEKYYIQFYNSFGENGYNLTLGGDGSSGYKPSLEVRHNSSEYMKAYWTDERKAEISVERRKPDSVYQSVEFKQKISNKVTGERNPNYNHKWTDEMKEALREKQKNNPIYRNENNPNAKRIMCVETGECFDCIKYAMEKYNIKTHGSITVALKYPTRTAGGKHWIIL